MGNGIILDSALPTTNFPYPTATKYTGGDGSQYTYESPVLAGIQMPGQWILTKLAKSMGVEVVPASYMSGAFLKLLGQKPIEIEYEVRIWESGTMGIFRGLLATLLKRPAVSLGGAIPAAAALTIADAAVNDMGVKSVVVAEVDYPKNPLVSSGGKGCWVGHVKLIQWLPPFVVAAFQNQDIPDPGAVTPTAAANLATATASLTAGANALQNKAAQALVPPP